MILKELIIENMFCYRGPVSFTDLAPKGDANIVLIQGRNNFGKTSFLRSLKLLLGGVTDELRYAAPTDRVPGHIQYVLGVPPTWAGVLNVEAKAAGERRFYVKGTFSLDDEQDMTVTRRWDPQSGQDTVEVVLAGVHYSYDDAVAHLLDVFPAYSLSYFFFDGEFIQQLAADAGDKTREMIERVLRLRPILNVSEVAEELSVVWTSESATPEARAQLNEAQRIAEEHRASLNRLMLLGANLREERIRLDSERARIDRDLTGIRDRGADIDASVIAARVAEVTAEFADLRRVIVNKLLPTAPFWADDLVWEELLAEPDAPSADATRHAALRFASRLSTDLLASEESPAWSVGQAEFVRARIATVVAEFVATAEDPKKSGGDRQAVRRHLVGARKLDPIAAFSRAQKLHARLEELARERSSAERISEVDRAAYLKAQMELVRTVSDAATVEAKIAENDSAVRSAAATCAEADDVVARRVSEIERRVGRTSRANRAKRAAIFLSEIAGRTLERRRGEITERATRHFGELFSSNTWVASVEVSRDFSLVCRTIRGIEIERASLSAGTRQLVALSVLWALCETAPLAYPVAIDTPLARLDEQHRRKVLLEYLPRASAQVFLLPTDAELPASELEAIEKHVYRHIVLVNPTSRAATLRNLR